MWTDFFRLPRSHPVHSFYWFYRSWENLQGLGGWRVYKKVKLAATVVIKTLCSFYNWCMWQKVGLSVATAPILSLTSFLWTTLSWSLLGVLIENYDFIFSNESKLFTWCASRMHRLWYSYWDDYVCTSFLVLLTHCVEMKEIKGWDSNDIFICFTNKWSFIYPWNKLFCFGF